MALSDEWDSVRALLIAGRHNPQIESKSAQSVPLLQLVTGGDPPSSMMYVKLNGEIVYLWRAVDHKGELIESYVTRIRDKDLALRFMKTALKRHGSPATIVTDGLRSYNAAMTDLGSIGKQGLGRHANNRAEKSHLSFRRRERPMRRFRRMKTLQKFASVHAISPTNSLPISTA